MPTISKINGLTISAADASYVAGGNVDGAVTLATTANTASYISPTFISASAAASGFGSGGGGSTTDISALNSFSGSMLTFTASIQSQVNAIKIATSSYIVNSQTASFVLNSQTASMSVLSASSALTASFVNTLNQNVTINGNLSVFGTASYTNVSSSELNIGTSLITVNTSNPTNRFGGLAVIDSGSTPRTSGSILFDSVNDQWIFIHNTAALTSSVFIQSPQTYNNLGNEINLTTNRLPKSVNAEHIGDSNISDTGTIVSINSNTQVTGSLRVTGGVTASLQGTATYANAAGAASQVYIAENTSPGTYSIPVYQEGNYDGDNTLYNANNVSYDFVTGRFIFAVLQATGSLQGTASYAVQALTASYISPTFISASAAASGFGSGGSSGPESDPIFAAWTGSAASYFAGTASYALSSAGVAGGVTSITAGDGISVDQSTGAVTITNTGGGGGGTNLGLVYAVSLGYLMP